MAGLACVEERTSLLSPKLFVTDEPSSTELSPFANIPITLQNCAVMCFVHAPRNAGPFADFVLSPTISVSPFSSRMGVQTSDRPLNAHLH
jgi:hypothetical protein